MSCSLRTPGTVTFGAKFLFGTAGNASKVPCIEIFMKPIANEKCRTIHV